MFQMACDYPSALLKLLELVHLAAVRSNFKDVPALIFLQERMPPDFALTSSSLGHLISSRNEKGLTLFEDEALNGDVYKMMFSLCISILHDEPSIIPEIHKEIRRP